MKLTLVQISIKQTAQRAVAFSMVLQFLSTSLMHYNRNLLRQLGENYRFASLMLTCHEVHIQLSITAVILIESGRPGRGCFN